MNRSQRILFLSNLVCLLGVSVAFIPFSKYLSKEFGLAAGWAIVLLSNKLPSFLLFGLADGMARRWGLQKLLTRTQLISAAASLLLAATLWWSPESWWLFFPMYLLLNVFRSFLLLLFPGAMQRWGHSEKDQKKNFSNWFILINFAAIAGVAVGGIFSSAQFLVWMFLLSAFGFLVSALTWRSISADAVSIPQGSKLRWSEWSDLILHPITLANLVRKFSYGLLNSLFPVLILTVLGMGSSAMSVLYLMLGVTALFGARLSREVRLNRVGFAVVLLIESSLLIAGAFCRIPTLTYALFGASAVLMAILDVEFQRIFVGSFSKTSTSASSSFEATVNLGLMTGYLIFGLAGQQLGVTGFGILVAAAALISQVIWWSFGAETKFKLSNLIRFGVLMALILTLGVSASSSIRLRGEVLKQFESNSARRTELIANLFQSSLEIGDYFEIQRLSTALVTDPELRFVEVKDRAGNLIVSAGPQARDPDTHSVITAPIHSARDPDKALGTIRVAYSYERFSDALFRNSSILLISIASIFIVLLAGLLFSYRYLSGYLKSLRSRFNDLVQGRISPAIQMSSIEEIREIDGFLEESFSQLASLREKEREQTRLEAAQRIATQVAHDIRSPLLALKVAERELQDVPEGVRGLLRSSIDRIQTIASDLHKSEVSSSKASIVPTAVSREPGDLSVLIAPLLMELLDEKRMEYRAHKNLKLILEIEPTLYFGSVQAERVSLLRAISNLVNNAIESMPSGGVVRVALKKSGEQNGMIAIEVTDQGQGIAPDLLPHIFDYGFSAGKQNGSGLGLYQVRQTLLDVQGEIKVRSQIGQGTQFSVLLLAAAGPSDLAQALADKAPAAAVILDDDESIGHLWRGTLKNIPSFAFRNISDLRHSMARFSNAIFLVDLELRGSDLDGIDFVKEFNLQASSVLVTSSWADASVQKRCAELGLRWLPKSMIPHIKIAA